MSTSDSCIQHQKLISLASHINMTKRDNLLKCLYLHYDILQPLFKFPLKLMKALTKSRIAADRMRVFLPLCQTCCTIVHKCSVCAPERDANSCGENLNLAGDISTLL